MKYEYRGLLKKTPHCVVYFHTNDCKTFLGIFRSPSVCSLL
jgi:hypothetical protein